MGNKVFVSYSRLDKDRVQIIVKEIQEHLGIQCWIDLTSLETNELFINTIKEAIDNCKILLFMYTKNSEASGFAQKEILYAQDNKKVIVLILLEDLVKDGWCNFLCGNVNHIYINDPSQRTKLYTFISRVLNDVPGGPDPNPPHYSMIDLGLSVCWAEYNLSFPNNNEYFLWGDIHRDVNVDFHNLPFEGLCKNIGGTRLDIARVTWGEKWRLPTDAEALELKERCKWKWTVRNGNKGYKVTGPNGNHIFLPALGYKQGNTTSCSQMMGCYWTDTINSKTKLPFCLCFGGGNTRIGSYSRYLGFSVRPVYKSK